MMDLLESAKHTLGIEIDALKALQTRIDESFTQACELIQNTQGRVIVVGMGKSGHIGKKIAATLASTGTPAFFVHPAEASHGDLGMITDKDCILAISNSGQTEEVTTLLPVIKRQGISLIAMTGNNDSVLAKQADVHLSIAVKKEACPLNLAPTASTTVTLALGDALAIALLSQNDFKKEDFARSHPGGSLGKRLLTHAKDIMAVNNLLPIVFEHTSLLDAIMEISSKGLGVACICESLETKHFKGVFTDGDLRRLLNQASGKIDLSKMTMHEVMHLNPTVIKGNILAAEALNIMESKKISSLPVINDQQQLVGVLTMHHLLQSGVV